MVCTEVEQGWEDYISICTIFDPSVHPSPQTGGQIEGEQFDIGIPAKRRRGEKLCMESNEKRWVGIVLAQVQTP